MKIDKHDITPLKSRPDLLRQKLSNAVRSYHLHASLSKIRFRMQSGCRFEPMGRSGIMPDGKRIYVGTFVTKFSGIREKL